MSTHSHTFVESMESRERGRTGIFQRPVLCVVVVEGLGGGG